MLLKLLRRLRGSWEYRVLNNSRRMRLILSCWFHGVELVLGRDVRFHHPVRLWGSGGGKIIIEDGVSFAFDGGGRWLGPIGIEMRDRGAELRIGQRCVIMRAVQIVCFAKITLGPETTIGTGCFLLDSDVHDFTPGAWDKPARCGAIVLGKRVHLCPEVTILRGVSVGEETLVGNKSVVQKTLPARCVAAGNPARVLLHYQANETEIGLGKTREAQFQS